MSENTLTPISAKVILNPIELDFYQALALTLEGKKIFKLEWGDKRHWIVLKDGILQVHKAGEANEVLHPLIINDGDIQGKDWIIIE